MSKIKRIQSEEGATRRLLPFNTEEAELRAIRYKGKIRVIRLPYAWGDLTPKEEARIDFARHNLFHHFVPGHSLEPVALHSFVDEKGRKRFGMVTNMVKGQTASTIVARQNLYKSLHGTYFPTLGRKGELEAKHLNFVSKVAQPLARQIREVYGISPKSNVLNVAEVDGQPKFFELDITKPRILRSRIDAIPDPKRRAELLSHLNAWFEIESKRRKAVEEYQRRWQKKHEEKRKARAEARRPEEQRRGKKTVWAKIRNVISNKKKPKK